MNEGLVQDLSDVIASINIRRHYGNLSEADNRRLLWEMRVISEAMEIIKGLKKE